jgi:hypothetical protein
MNSIIFCHEGDLFAVKPLSRQAAFGESYLVRLQTTIKSEDFGQRLFLGLLEQESLTVIDSGSPGVGLSLDPETGAVEDLINDSGVIGYLSTLPQEPNQEIIVTLEAHVYGRVMIPKLMVGQDVVLHPAILLNNGPEWSAFGGSEIMNGTAAEFSQSTLQLVRVRRQLPTHAPTAVVSV